MSSSVGCARWVSPALLAAWVSACGTAGPSTELAPLPEEVCDERFAAADGWCAGDPSGQWTYRSTCNRTVLTWLQETCPAGSFEMHPGAVTGTLTLTSTTIESEVVHDLARPVTIDLHRACIQVLGTCPRSYQRNPLVCEGDFTNECHCQIGPVGYGETDFGAVTLDGGELVHDFDPSYRGQFCAEERYLYLQLPRPSTISNDYYFILSRDP